MVASRRRNDLVETQLTIFTRLLDKVAAGEVRAIHKARVASRRLRELLPLLALEQETAGPLMRDLRRATRALGRVRELDVTGQLVERLGTEFTGEAAAIARLQAHVGEERTAAFKKETRRGHLGRDLRRLAKKLSRVISADVSPAAAPRAAREWRWALDARLARRAEAVRAAVKDAGPFYVPERLHAVRIALKKLRYAVEIAGEADGRLRGELSRLRKLQELLGVLHDRQLLIERVRALQAAMPAGNRRVTRDLDRIIARLEDDCRALHARYLRQRTRLLDVCDAVTPQTVPAARRPAPRASASR